MPYIYVRRVPRCKLLGLSSHQQGLQERGDQGWEGLTPLGGLLLCGLKVGQLNTLLLLVLLALCMLVCLQLLRCLVLLHVLLQHCTPLDQLLDFLLLLIGPEAGLCIQHPCCCIEPLQLQGLCAAFLLLGLLLLLLLLLFLSFLLLVVLLLLIMA
jgi:hypothetical protein